MTSSHVVSAVFLVLHVDQQLQGGLSISLQRTNSPHIDVAHVALAKVDANYIARLSSRFDLFAVIKTASV